jgi:plasmid stabilization system protein ParE
LDQLSVEAAVRAGVAIDEAILSLREFPLRAQVRGPGGLRELIVPFGSSAYIIRYVVRDDDVFVVRIFHGKERR